MKKKAKAAKKSSSKAGRKAQPKMCECCGRAPCACGKDCTH